MEIKKVANGIEIHVGSQESASYFLQKALKQLKNKKKYTYSTAYASNFRIDVQFISTPIKKELKKRKAMLERAKKIKLIDFTEEFRLASIKQNQGLISQFCNAFKKYFKNETLDFLIKHGKEEVLNFRSIGHSSLDLFEKFLNSKKFEFAKWNGEKWI